MQHIAECLYRQNIHENDKALIILLSCAGGIEMYAAFSSSNKENQAVQSTLEPEVVKHKQILNSEGLFLHLQPIVYITYQ
jgi:hypothetical protein